MKKKSFFLSMRSLALRVCSFYQLDFHPLYQRGGSPEGMDGYWYGVVLSHEGERRLRLASFWVTPKRTCLLVICSSVVGQLRWKEHIKKHKKFLIFLIDNLNFIFLCKIRNNDRTISMTVLCCLNFSDKELFAFKRLVYFSSIIFPQMVPPTVRCSLSIS